MTPTSMAPARLDLAAGILVGLVAAGGVGCRRTTEAGDLATRIRLGFFLNVTHAPAMAGLAHGSYEAAVAPARLEVKAFASGPEAIEAIFAGAIDLCFVGPGPALNGYLRSEGTALRVIAGAATGGAAFVVRADAGIGGPEDLHHHRIASPQLGNTQDLALRLYLATHHLRTTEVGGDVQVVPISNPDILQLMKQGKLDGAWVPEPWVTRLLHEANGRVLVDEHDLWPNRRFPTAVLIATTRLLELAPTVVRRVVAAEAREIAWLDEHPAEGAELVSRVMKEWGKKPLPPAQMAESWRRVEFSTEPLADALSKIAADGRKLGYLPKAGDVRLAIDRRFLPAVDTDASAP
jgi:NitT/TauT family transport system substrate-binding protein